MITNITLGIVIFEDKKILTLNVTISTQQVSFFNKKNT